MTRKRPSKTTANKQSHPTVNQPALTSERTRNGKTELLVNEVVKNPQVIERLMMRPDTAGLIMQVSHTRSGPLPDPDELARYEKVCPGFAREIMDMAKSEQKHRHTHSNKGQSGAIWRDRLGQIFGLVCVFVFSYIAFQMIEQGAYGWATGLLGVELVALTGVFVIGRQAKATTITPSPKKD